MWDKLYIVAKPHPRYRDGLEGKKKERLTAQFPTILCYLFIVKERERAGGGGKGRGGTWLFIAEQVKTKTKKIRYGRYQGPSIAPALHRFSPN